jgi:4-hydroxybenzoate polyprenyltransferase
MQIDMKEAVSGWEGPLTERRPPDNPSLARSTPGSLALDLLRLCRPRHWTKNAFVLAPLVFSGATLQLTAVLHALTALLSFCLLSSAVYCWNDVLDAEADRRHPRKRTRPVAAGRVSRPAALALGLALTLAAAGLGLTVSRPLFLLLGGLYVASSLLYCAFLKYRVIVDVLSIAIGFVLRVLAGCAAIGVTPTSWILVCGFSLAMLLGFGKRRLELGAMNGSSEYRPTLQSYSAEKLNILLGVASSTCLLSYMLYTVSPQTIRLHGTENLVYTVPFVAYGIFRYIFKVQERKHDGPVEVLLADPVFALNGFP